MNTTVGSTNLYYDERGTGETILFLHAFPLDHSMWL
jgi:hypothetical protein